MTNSGSAPDTDAARDGDTVVADSVTGGTYTLLVDVPTDITVEVGALGTHGIPAGAYAYTGSALGAGGFSRVERHRRVARGDHEVRHWHIDYLLGHPDTDIDHVVRSVGVDVECAVAGRLPTGPIDGFGASDCDCESHLAAGATVEGLAAHVYETHEDAVAYRNGAKDSVTDTVDVVSGAGGTER